MVVMINKRGDKMIYTTDKEPTAYFVELLNLGDAVIQNVKDSNGKSLTALVTWGRNITQEFVDKTDSAKVDFVKSPLSDYYEKIISRSISEA